MVLFFNCILSQTNNQVPKSIHDFNVQDIYGNDFDFNSLKGKKVMVVNTASIARMSATLNHAFTGKSCFVSHV